MSCPYASTRFVCANKGSSTVLTFKIVVSVVYSPFEEGRLRREKRPLRNLTITVDLYIHNVTFEDRGFYDIYDFNEMIALQVFSKWLSFRRVFHTHTVATVIQVLPLYNVDTSI